MLVRLGFVLLLVLLGAFAVLFVHERNQTDAALDRERDARKNKVLGEFKWDLDRKLDVAEARLEALETLPYGDDEGLLLIRDGVQLVPRVPASASGPPRGEFPESIPWLSKDDVAAKCVEAERAGNFDLAKVCRRALTSELIKTPYLVYGWHTVRRGDEVHGVHFDGAEVFADLKEGDEAWTFSTPFEVAYASERLNAAHAEARSTLLLKSGLLALTASLGLGVVWLSWLSQRRKEESLQAQRDFVATVSHELKTPLASIRLLAETIERKGPVKDYPQRIVAATDGLTFFVENILSFNRLESGRWVPKLEPFEFASLERMIRDDVASMIDVNVELAFHGDMKREVDHELIKILALNLIRNSIRYCARSPVKISVSADENRLLFADNGPGIPASERERVFEAFHRLGNKGSGLGLALVKRIAQLHGGDARLKSSSDQGTVVEVSLR
ncbi:MAG: sensor histidine kinase [Archangium sp.]